MFSIMYQTGIFRSRFAMRECHIFMEWSSEAVAHKVVSEADEEGRKATQLTQSECGNLATIHW